VVKIHTVFGGKNPHPNYLVGGVPCSIDTNEVAAINSERLNLVARLISQAMSSSTRFTFPICWRLLRSTRTGRSGAAG